MGTRLGDGMVMLVSPTCLGVQIMNTLYVTNLGLMHITVNDDGTADTLRSVFGVRELEPNAVNVLVWNYVNKADVNEMTATWFASEDGQEFLSWLRDQLRHTREEHDDDNEDIS